MLKVEIDKEGIDKAFENVRENLISYQVYVWYGEDIDSIEEIRIVLVIDVEITDEGNELIEDRITTFDGKEIDTVERSQLVSIIRHISISTL